MSHTIIAKMGIAGGGCTIYGQQVGGGWSFWQGRTSMALDENLDEVWRQWTSEPIANLLDALPKTWWRMSMRTNHSHHGKAVLKRQQAINDVFYVYVSKVRDFVAVLLRRDVQSIHSVERSLPPTIATRQGDNTCVSTTKSRRVFVVFDKHPSWSGFDTQSTRPYYGKGLRIEWL